MDNFKCAGNIIKWNNDNQIDQYETVNSFKSKRRSKEECFELLSFYSDLDIYNSKFIKKHMRKINKYISRSLGINNISEETLTDEHVEYFTPYMNLFHTYIIKYIVNKSIKLGIGKPSKINFSGRGYHIYWDIESRKIINCQYYGMHGNIMQKQYNTLQKTIQNEFKYFGSDPRATDLSRVLRVPGTVNSKTHLTCETVYQTNTSNKFSFYADRLYKYTFRQYKKYIQKTSKIQQDYIKKLVNTFEIPTEVLKSDFNLLVTDRYNDIDYVNTIEGTKIISKIRSQYVYTAFESKGYINTLLLNCLARKHVKEGNRSIFFYYFGLGCKRQEIKLDEAILLALEINQKINFNENELENSIRSAYKVENLNISKKRILSDLSIPNDDKDNCIKGKRIRTTKRKKSIVKLILIKNYDKYLSESDRSLAKVFSISKSTINKLKQEIKVIIFSKRQLLKIIKIKDVDSYRCDKFNQYCMTYYKNLIDIRMSGCEKL